jgi:hypothetical protein
VKIDSEHIAWNTVCTLIFVLLATSGVERYRECSELVAGEGKNRQRIPVPKSIEMDRLAALLKNGNSP